MFNNSLLEIEANKVIDFAFLDAVKIRRYLLSFSYLPRSQIFHVHTQEMHYSRDHKFV